MTEKKKIDLDIDGDGETDVIIEDINGHKVWLNLSSLKRLAIFVGASCLAMLGMHWV